jgi:hypothetical protein
MFKEKNFEKLTLPKVFHTYYFFKEVEDERGQALSFGSISRAKGVPKPFNIFLFA